ncbi:MAG: hypothetical protein FWE06_06720 [Oscillospiraceae bacterium]|nr:hypothetical protein [Oscillospiraceae bacterium]
MGRGSAINPWGEFIFTADELMENYDGMAMAGTWIRDAIPPNDRAYDYIERAFDLGLLSQRSQRVLNTSWREGISRLRGLSRYTRARILKTSWRQATRIAYMRCCFPRLLRRNSCRHIGAAVSGQA